MTRRHLAFECEGSRLVGTIDGSADATSGLLLVTGGNELRSGAFSGQAQLAARLAEKGFAVMRFDRRGTGDSEGGNGEFRTSGPDLAAALAAFRQHCPALTRIVGFGNCDGASALMLARGAGCDALVLSNPWTFEGTGEDEQESPPEVVRDHYRKRLTDLAAIKRAWRRAARCCVALPQQGPTLLSVGRLPPDTSRLAACFHSLRSRRWVPSRLPDATRAAPPHSETAS